MRKKRKKWKRKPNLFRPFIPFVFLAYILAGCGGNGDLTSTLEADAFKPPASEPTSDPSPQPLPSPTPTQQEDCTNLLRFEKDLSVPDGTRVSPGQSIQKQWLVTNAGTCNWDQEYAVKHIAGPDLGAPQDQDLYPARNGQQVILQMMFTAPENPGTYISTWQAFDPQGNRFGDPFFINIQVMGD